MEKRNTRSLFPLKDKTEHVSPIIYEKICKCIENYIGQTVQNVTIRLSGDFDKKRSEPAKHTIIAIINVLKIKNGITHSTTEKVTESSRTFNA